VNGFFSKADIADLSNFKTTLNYDRAVLRTQQLNSFASEFRIEPCSPQARQISSLRRRCLLPKSNASLQTLAAVSAEKSKRSWRTSHTKLTIADVFHWRKKPLVGDRLRPMARLLKFELPRSYDMERQVIVCKIRLLIPASAKTNKAN
jgi:hypothetical protein